MPPLLQLRLILRRLVSSPSFTVVSVATLALGIAGNMAIVSVVNALLLRPLPYPESEDLVLLWHTAPTIDLPMIGQADATYFLYLDEVRGLDGISLAEDGEVTLLTDGVPERVGRVAVTASFFGVMRSPPALGRTLLAADEAPGAAPVAVIADRLWRRSFDADPSALGQRIDLNGVATEIVGVLAPGFEYLSPKSEIYVPMTMDRSQAKLDGFGITGIGRLAEGATAQSVETEMNTLLSNLTERFPDDPAAPFFADSKLGALIRPAHEFLVGDIEATLWIVLAAVGFLLLIACANVANLFLVRSEGRQRELAIRHALGESRGRMATATLAESATVGLVSGLVALPIGTLATRLLVRFGPQELPRLHEVAIDARVVAFAIALSLLAGLLFGLLPALRGGLSNLAAALTDGTRSMTTGRRGSMARSSLVVAQIALALILLIGSGLAARSYTQLSRVAPGFEPEGVATFQLYLPATDYAEPEELLRFHHDLADRLAEIPGVESATAVSTAPMSSSINGEGFVFEGRPLQSGEVPPVLFTKSVADDYLATLRLPLLEGRALERADMDRNAKVALVSKNVAEHYWPGESAVGKRFAPDSERPETDQGWFEIVGVVSDVRDRGLHEDAPELVYFPLSNAEGAPVPRRSMTFMMRGERTTPLIAAARTVVRAADPGLPLANVSTLRRIVDRSRQVQSFTLALLMVSSGFALLLGAVGLYGVISYVVSQRRREIAVRVAVGARFADICSLVLREALLLGVIGVGVGLVGAFALTRSMASLLYEVSPLDPATYVAVPLMLLAVALGASYLPARRAARVDPAEVLRAD